MRTLTMLVAVSVAIGGCKPSPTKIKETTPLTLRDNYTETEIIQGLKVWPRLLMPPATLGQRPAIALPPPPFATPSLGTEAVLTADSPAYQALFNRLHILLQTSPLAELRNELLPMIESGEVLPCFGYRPGSIASLNLVNQETVAAIMGRGHSGSVAKQLVMSFDANELAKIANEDQAANFLLVVLHENTHVEQFKKGAELLGANVSFTPVQCANVWRDERSAYLKQCATSNRWGGHAAIGFDDLCVAADSPDAFSQRLFARLLWNEFTYQTNLLRCAYVWALYAQHPHPELFR